MGRAAQDTLPRPMLETTPRHAARPRRRGKGDAKVIVVMPARNAAKTLEATVDGIPKAWVDEIILVDDSSTDDTVELARKLPLHVVWHPHNVGYGGNQKTCYLEALQRDADVVVMLHPDGQYEPEIIPKLVAPIVAGEADIVLGSRFLDPDGAVKGGMPWWKRAANRGLTTRREPPHGHRPLRARTPATARSRASCCSRCRSCATRSTSRSTPSC